MSVRYFGYSWHDSTTIFRIFPMILTLLFLLQCPPKECIPLFYTLREFMSGPGVPAAYTAGIDFDDDGDVDLRDFAEMQVRWPCCHK